MSYVKNTWASGDLITAQKLNNIENGVENASAAALPVYDTSDRGKYLGVVVSSNSPILSWESIPDVLPAYSSDQKGKYLAVNNVGTSLQ